MKKLIKRISGILAATVLATTLTFNFGVQATEGSLLTEGQEGFLAQLSIIPNEALDYGKALTRAELAHMAAKLSNAPAYTEEGEFFYDVPKDHPYRADIYALAQKGILHGDGNGYFRPDEEISDLEICKVFSVILGYDPIGKFDSYIRIARDAGVSDGVNMDGVVTYAEAMLMAHNTLHCEMMEVIGYGETNKYKVTKGYRAVERYHGLVKQEGLVEGVCLTTLEEANSDIAEGHILINGRQFHCEDETLLGKYVVFYSKRDGDSTDKEIQYIYAHEGMNNIMTLKGEAVSRVTDTEIKYYVKEKEKSVKITGKTDVIINGVAYPGYTEADLKAIMATLTLIDNNNDKVYDVIVVDSPTFMIVESVDTENKMISGRYPEMIVGSSTREEDIRILLPRGEAMLSMLPTGTAVAVSQSWNKTGTLKIRLNGLGNGVQGQVETLMNNKITVAGKEYKMTTATVTDEEVRLGDTVTVYPYGEYAAIVLHAANDNYRFGYLVNARREGSALSDGNIVVKLVDTNRVLHELTGTEVMMIDESKYTKAEAVLDRLLASAQSRVFATGTSQKILDENARLPYSQPIRYKLNNEGLVTHIDTVIYDQSQEAKTSLRPMKDEITSAYYSVHSRSFYNKSTSVNDFLFSVPALSNIIFPPDENRDLTERYGTGYPIDGSDCVVEAYTVDPDNYVAEYLIAYTSSFTAGDASAVGVVTSMYSGLDEEGMVVTKADMKNPRVTKTITLTESVAAQWEVGDIVLYNVDGNNVLKEGDDNWRYLFDYSLGKDQPRVNFGGGASYTPSYYNIMANIRISYGTVLSVKDGIITHVNSVVEDDGWGVVAPEGLQNYRAESITVYVYETIGGTPVMRIGSLSDVVPYNTNPDSGQKVVIGTRSSGRMEYMVVYK
ncbi:MAG: S-layer homology domain-containing protein [Clostridia bacterium]|nr:S-layer homology domain-containing protein [Clostridia bacterium]